MSKDSKEEILSKKHVLGKLNEHRLRGFVEECMQEFSDLQSSEKDKRIKELEEAIKEILDVYKSKHVANEQYFINNFEQLLTKANF